MNNVEKELIKKLISGKLSRTEFIKLYPIDFNTEKHYVLNGFIKAIEGHNAEDVEYFILLISFASNWQNIPEYSDVFSKLLLEPWHYSHEGLASLLQGAKNPDTIDSLFKACFLDLDYMDYDENYSLARKCIHALGDINTENARDKLRELAKSDITIIREKAGKQLYI